MHEWNIKTFEINYLSAKTLSKNVKSSSLSPGWPYATKCTVCCKNFEHF